MRVAVVVLVLAACTTASGVNDGVTLTDPSLGSHEAMFNNQPVIIVRKTTYYEPELVAVVVEKAVDDIPEETVLIQNYADVLGASNNEIHLCAVDNTNTCLDTPVTKFLVPSLFQSIGQSGFKKFFEQVKDVPWISTLDNAVKLVNPVLSRKNSELSKLFDEKPNILSLDSFKPIQVVPSDIFRYIPETPVSPEYHTVYPSPSTSISTITRTETPQTIPVSYDVSRANYISPSATVLPSNIQAGFAPLDQISTGGSILGAPSARTTYTEHPIYYDGSLLRARRAIAPIPYFYSVV